jgi:ABC-type multidrug transport system fused ATPase/permease subunit
MRRMDRNQKFFFHLWMSMSWVTARLEFGTSCVLLSLALLSVCLRSTVRPATLGLALSYAMTLTALFQRCVQVAIDVGVYMTSTERVLEYLDIPQELNVYRVSDCEMQEIAGIDKAANDIRENESVREVSSMKDDQKSAIDETTILLGPSQSTGINTVSVTDEFGSENAIDAGEYHVPVIPAVEFRDVWMRYRANTPFVLRGLSMCIRRGERIGICGRTGAGKSSVMAALFRVIELSRGCILIGGNDIGRTPLQQLRSSISIIPQDPVLFTGSLRFQVDPFNQYTDVEIWHVLEQVSLSTFVREVLPGNLQAVIKENGENLSQGQRQLLCIARALLRRAPLLVMDEGTSAVDPSTDETIQKVLRAEALARGTTILAIAHRVQTIIDFDRIMVLGEGRILEFETPAILLANSHSVFSAMVAEARH